MKYTDTINKMILDRKLSEDQTCKKTWKNLRAYKDSHKHNDVRYDKAARLRTKWKGGEIEEYFDRMPLSIYVNETKIRYHIDYGSHKNKISYIYEEEFIANPELAYEYKMYHSPENDHCPIPKSKGGEFKLDNLECVPKYANVSSQDVDVDYIIESYYLGLQVYIDIKNKIAKRTK